MYKIIESENSLLALTAALCLTVASPVLADGNYFGRHNRNNDSVCEQTAETMLKACFFDVGDDLHTTLAHCENMGDRGERRACIAEARETRRDDTKLCREVEEAREDVCELLGEDRYDPDPLTGVSLTGEPIAFVDPDSVNVGNQNPFVSIVAGHTHVLRAGEDFEETIVVHVTEDVREILGVLCRVVVDIVVLVEDGEYQAVEVTDDYFAQSTVGDVYYCGEIARNFDEEGALVDLDGSFEAGRDYAKAGILIKANPAAGEVHRQEFLLAEAEDVIRYVDTMAEPTEEEGGENPNPLFDCSLSGLGCVKTEEFIPPDPESGEFKYYIAGIGFVLGVALEDGEISGERDELLCTGPSLAVLSDPSCGIADPDALLEELCKLSPDAFCVD